MILHQVSVVLQQNGKCWNTLLLPLLGSLEPFQISLAEGLREQKFEAWKACCASGSLLPAGLHEFFSSVGTSWTSGVNWFCWVLVIHA